MNWLSSALIAAIAITLSTLIVHSSLWRYILSLALIVFFHLVYFIFNALFDPDVRNASMIKMSIARYKNVREECLHAVDLLRQKGADSAILHEEVLIGVRMAKSVFRYVAVLIMIDDHIVNDAEKEAIGRIADKLCERPIYKRE